MANQIYFGNDLVSVGELYLNFSSAYTLTLNTDITTGRFVFLSGTLDLNTHTIATSNDGGGDFVVFGALPNYSVNDPDWTGGDTRFEYPDQAGLIYDPGSGSYDAVFSNLDNSTITVGGNFYINGTDLPAAANWSLNLQDNTASNPQLNNTAASTATAWGIPYNIAFNVSDISYSQVTGGSIAASENVTNTTGNKVYNTPSGTVGWDFTNPDFFSVRTVWDSVIEVVFNEAIENSNNEIAGIIGSVNFLGLSADGTSGDAVNGLITNVYKAFDPVTGTGSNPITAVVGAGDTDTIYVEVTGIWNTDADGVSSGNADTLSSDSWGNHQANFPDISTLKTVLYDAGGKNPLGQYGNHGFGIYNGTSDGAGPALVAVKAGTAAYNANPSTDYSNGHNYFIFRFSERMSFSSLGTGNIAANSNTRVGGQAVDSGVLGHMQDQLVAGTVNVDGLMDYSGIFDSGYIPAFSIDPTPDYINTLERTTPYEIRVDIAAYYDVGNTNWPGFLGSSGINLTNPDGLVFTGVNDSTIQDLVGNNAVAVNNGRTINQDMGFNSGSGWVGITETGWDVDPPILAPYKGSATFEIIPEDEDSNTFLDRFEFNVLDNSSDTATWNSETDHPNALGGGIRDNSLQSNLAFEFQSLGNEPADLTAPTFVTDVLNSVFSLAGINVVDDSYFSIYPAGNTSWDTLTKLWVDYNEDEGYLTDHAGNRLRTFSKERAVEIVPPNISLTLAAPGNSWGYVKFSEPVYGNDTASAPIAASDFSLSGVSGIAITAVEAWPGGAASQEYRFRFSSALTENDILSATINILPLSVYDSEGNYARSQLVYRVSDLGFGIVEPLWASDGIHSEDIREGTSLTVFDGTGKLMDRDILLQARINATSFQGLSMSMYYDANVPSDLVTNNLWLPYYQEELAPSGNYEARYVNPSALLGNGLQEFSISSSDEEMETDNTMEFYFMLNGLPCVDLDDSDDIFSFHPWSFQIKDIRKQRGGVTILNNIINPNDGDEAILMYDIDDPGIVTVQVFALNGNMVRILQRGRQAEGTYQYLWDGRNNSGRIVARGVYFIRVVGPEVDEIRKVMVIK